jgi:hypothetical protein
VVSKLVANSIIQHTCAGEWRTAQRARWLRRRWQLFQFF